MQNHVMIVYTNPVAGREEEFNQWYDDIHLRDLLAVPGFIAARRYRLSDAQSPNATPSPFQYLCIYEIESDDLETTVDTLEAAVAKMYLSDAAQSVADFHNFTAVGPRRAVR